MRATAAILDSLQRLALEGRLVEHRPTTPAAPLAEDISERDFMAEVVAFAKSRGWLVYHTQNSRRSEPGFPDLVMLKGESCLVAECKTATGQLTADQATWLDGFQAAGIPAYCWRPADWPEIVDTLAGVSQS